MPVWRFCARPAGVGEFKVCRPPKHQRLIQVYDYALVDGACGDPSLHMVLIERGPAGFTWLFDRAADEVTCALRRCVSYDANDRRFILYNRAWIEMSELAERGDMTAALEKAEDALRYQPSGAGCLEPIISEVRNLQGLPRAEAIVRWKQFRIDNAPEK